MAHKQPPLSRLHFYYGWVVIAVAAISLAVAVNARTAFSLLYPPMLDDLGWHRGVTAGAFSVGFIASAAFMPVIGLLMDRWGPRLVIPLGAALVACGFAGAAFVSTPVAIYLTLGLLVVGGSIAVSYISHSMFLPNWFVRRRGLAIGVAFSGVGIGAIILLPLVQLLIEGAGWRSTCLVIAATVAAVLIPLNLWLQRGHPEQVGALADGEDSRRADADPRPDTVVDRAWAETDWTLGKAARTARFWWIFLGYFCALFAWYAVQVHQTRYLLDIGFDGVTAASALGLVGLFGIAGQIGIGGFSDRFGREWGWTVALLGYGACYAALLALETRPSTALLYVMVGTQGLFGYGIASLYGAIPAEIFSGPRFATIFAVTGLGGNLGAGVGPWVMGAVYDRTGSYAPAFWLSLGVSLLSIVCIWMAAPRHVRLVGGRAQARARKP